MKLVSSDSHIFMNKDETFFAILTNLLVCLLRKVVSFVDSDDEHEFDYKKNGEKGPDKWGELKPEWSLCSNGTMQSPIDLLSERAETVSHLGKLKRSYRPSDATLMNRGHDMKVINYQKE